MSLSVPRATLCVLLVWAPCLVAAEKKPVTIESMYAQPEKKPAGAPVWAPDGKRFVYRSNGKLMLFDTASKGERELIAFEVLEKAAAKPPVPAQFEWENRRVHEDAIQWAPSGAALLLTVDSDLFWLDAGTCKWQQLTNTPDRERDPKLSPDGTRIAFRREHDLYVMDVASRKVRRLTEDGSATLRNGELDWVYPEELDLGTAYWWSPDSRRIAYLQFDISRQFVYPHADLQPRRAVYEPQRYPQAGTPNASVRVGVVPVDGKRTSWMSLGDTSDALLARVTWFPDGKRIAVVRLNRVQNRLDLLSVDAGSGRTSTTFSETDPYWINVAEEPKFFGSSGAFIWSSERDGYRHLYVYENGREIQITKGAWEVASVSCIDEAQRRVYFVSTQASPLERQLYSVGLDGSGLRRITEAAGTHAISMAPACRYYVDSFSSLTLPSRRTVNGAAGGEVAILTPGDTKERDEYNLLPVEVAELKASDGTTLYGQLIKPANFDAARRYPAIVQVYGGPGAQQVVNKWAGADFDQVLAHRGFVVWKLDNRGGTGRGHAFESPLFRRLGKVELEDQLVGIRYLESLDYVDMKRVGITGWSYGGFMTLYSLFNAPGVFKAGIAGAPVTDWHLYDTIYTERYLGLPSENEAGYKDSAAQTYAGNLKGRLLLIHNTEDDNVLFQNTLQLVAALEKERKAFTQVLYPFKTHGVTGASKRHLQETMLDFFERNL